MTSDWREFVNEQLAGGATPGGATPAGAVPGRVASWGAVSAGGAAYPLVGCYGDHAAEYRALAEGAGLVDRSYRALLEVTGRDRAGWVHNLTTNEVRALQPGDGNYAFACNAQGRILFDLNILVRDGAIWFDIDRHFLERAKTHFGRYIIVEDVTVTDRTEEIIRLGISGVGAAALLGELGATNAGNLPVLGAAAVSFKNEQIPVIRTDFCGPVGFELFVPESCAVALWQSLCGAERSELGRAAVPVGDDAVQIRRIEAGLPWPGREITDEMLPAETRQLVRAVSTTKGCYLGQEVVERMRSRDVVARQLVGIRLPDEPRLVEARKEGTEPALEREGQPVGKLTSVVRSPVVGTLLGMGYVKTTAGAPGTTLEVTWSGGKLEGVIVELPVSGGPNV